MSILIDGNRDDIATGVTTLADPTHSNAEITYEGNHLRREPSSSASTLNRSANSSIAADTSNSTDTLPSNSKRSARSVAKPARFRESSSPPPVTHLAIDCPLTTMHHNNPSSSARQNHPKTPKPVLPQCRGRNNAVPNLPAPTRKPPTIHQRNKSAAKASQKSCGGWSDTEQSQFLNGCIQHGWGKWSSIQDVIPSRDRHQIKSHAQKFQRSYPEIKLDLIRRHLLFINPMAEKVKESGGTRKQQSASNMQRKRKPVVIVSESKSLTKSDKRHKVSSIESSSIMMSTKVPPPVKQELVHSDDHPTKSGGHTIVPSLNGNDPTTTAVIRPLSLVGPTDDNMIAPHLQSSNGIIREVVEPTDTDLVASLLGLGPENNQLKHGPKTIDEPSSDGSGTWSTNEHLIFERGCVIHGWGRWSLISSTLPTRTRQQVKSHAQKFERNHPIQKARIDRAHDEYLRICISKVSPPPPQTKRKKCLGKSSSSSGGECTAPKPSTAARRYKNTTPVANDSLAPKLQSTTANLTSRRDSGWSSVEEKQFEDGCIFHGWGNWRDIASHVFTKSMPQVFTFAQSYNREDIESLEREHKLHYQSEGNTASDEKNDEPSKIHHALLGTGRMKSKDKSTVPHRTTFDDYGAAAAILALSKL
jgi:SHAQKYF class myb-like DNA-binding protein